MKPLTCAILFISHIAVFWIGSALAEQDAEVFQRTRRQAQLQRFEQAASYLATNAYLHAQAATGTNNAAEHAIASQALSFARSVVQQTIEEVRQLP